MANGTKSYEPQFNKWLASFLKSHGLKTSKPGSRFKFGPAAGHTIDKKTGYWKDPSHSNGIAPRWIYQIDYKNGGWIAVRPTKEQHTIIGVSNTSQEKTAAVIFRLLPLVNAGSSGYIFDESLEAHVIFMFRQAIPKGTSAEPIKFNPITGEMKYMNDSLTYLCAALLGIRPRNSKVTMNAGANFNLPTYGEIIDAISADMTSNPATRE